MSKMDLVFNFYLYGRYEDDGGPDETKRIIIYGSISPQDRSPINSLEGVFVTNLERAEMFGVRGELGSRCDSSVIERKHMESYERELKGKFIPFRIPLESVGEVAHRVNNGKN